MEDGDAASGAAIVGEELPILLGAEFDASDVFEAGDLAPIFGIGFDDNLVEVFGAIEGAFEIDGELVSGVGGGGWSADLACGDIDTLSAHGGHDIIWGEGTFLEFLGIQPDAHAVRADAEDGYAADAFDASEFIFEINFGEVIEVETIELFLGRGEGDDLEDGGGFGLGDHALGLDGGGELGEGGGHAILDEDFCAIGVGADIEGNDQGIVAFVGAEGLHIDHAFDAIDLLFDGESDLIDHRAGTGPWVGGGDLDGWGGNGGELGDGEAEDGDASEEHHDEGENVGENGPLDEEFREHALVTRRCWFGGWWVLGADLLASV